MQKSFLRFLFSILLISSFSPACFSQGSVTKVILIRHGEKPAAGEHLSCQGLNRSMQLPQVLFTKFGKPDYTFVPSIATGKATSSVRMLETVVPFAVKYNLAINSKYDKEDATGVANAILKKSSGTTLLVWEHKMIPAIAAALGVKEPDLKWNENDFDSIWIITLTTKGATLTRDKEGLHPAAACP